MLSLAWNEWFASGTQTQLIPELPWDLCNTLHCPTVCTCNLWQTENTHSVHGCIFRSPYTDAPPAILKENWGTVVFPTKIHMVFQVHCPGLKRKWVFWEVWNPALERQGKVVLWLKWDPVVPEKLAEEEPWKKVGIKPFCLCLHLVCLFRFIFLFLSSHESCANASSSNVRDWYQALHSSKAWKGSKPWVPLMFFEAQNKWLGHLPCSKWPAANQTTHLSQIPLGACGGQFHTQWVLHPTQWKSYFHTHFEAWLLGTKQCRIRSFFSLVFPDNQPAGLWKNCILILFVKLWYDSKDMRLISYSFQFTLMLQQCLMYILI